MPYDPKTGTVTFPGFNSTADIIAGRTGAMTPAVTPIAPESSYDKLLRVMSGGSLADTLSSGDKLMALSALLGSVARGSRTTPQEVMAGIRKEQAGRLEAQVMYEQMKAQQQLKQTFLNSLPQNERNMVALLDDKALAQYMLTKQKGRELTDAEKKIQAAGIPLDSERARRILENVASSQGIITVTGPTGTTYIEAGDLTKRLGAAAPTIPQKAIDDLRAGKGTVEQFEAVFGKGTARQYLGGGSGDATGGFR